MIQTRSLALLVLSGLWFFASVRPGAASAGALSLNLDPAKSTVRFTLGATLHTVNGTFAFKQGTIRFDPSTGQADGDVVIDLASGQSGDAKRDARMRSDVLEVQTYPYAVFHASRVVGRLADGSSGQLDVEGVLSIHGGQHPTTLHVAVDETKDGSMTARTHFSVPYVQWGMKDPSTFFLRVGKTVDIDVTAVGQEHQS